ncbi:hypothetical protein LR48_Vigan538s000200 [Vigna angularis]|uniref:Uncharacterized protein n=1 Tax=Phaseolus angularis TaxID=3914 RepID=A0A0L9TDX8_PHAAN|nr:hypothetical protein LR48_Vigan538s000200 [Vigna angularis]
MPPPVQEYHSQQYDAPAQTTSQPSTYEPTLQELLEQMTMQNLKFKQESMKIQQETQAAMQNLSNQIGQMATLALEENADDFEDQARISNNPEPGRPPSSSHTIEIFKEEEVSIPQFDYYVDCDDDRYANDYIVAESDFNFSSVHDENRFLLSHSNVYSSCTEHESESMINIACNLEIDSCYEDLSKVQPITLGLGVIPLHDISAKPFCTNHIAGVSLGSAGRVKILDVLEAPSPLASCCSIGRDERPSFLDWTLAATRPRMAANFKLQLRPTEELTVQDDSSSIRFSSLGNTASRLSNNTCVSGAEFCSRTSILHELHTVQKQSYMEYVMTKFQSSFGSEVVEPEGRDLTFCFGPSQAHRYGSYHNKRRAVDRFEGSRQ